MSTPCYNVETHTDCHRRHAGCAVDCPEWAKHVAERGEVYKERYEAGEIKHIAYQVKADRTAKKLKRVIENRASGFRKNR